MPEVADVQHDETAEREAQEQSAPAASEPRPVAPVEESAGAIILPAVEPPAVERVDPVPAGRAAAPIGRDRWVRETVTLGLTGETYRLESRIARPRRFGRLPRWASALVLAFVVILSTLACVAALQAGRLGHDLLQPPAVTAPAGTPHVTPSAPKK